MSIRSASIRVVPGADAREVRKNDASYDLGIFHQSEEIHADGLRHRGVRDMRVYDFWTLRGFDAHAQREILKYEFQEITSHVRLLRFRRFHEHVPG